MVPAMEVVSYPQGSTREGAMQAAFVRFSGEQWARWAVSQELEDRIRQTLATRFDELFSVRNTPAVTCLAGLDPGREVLITWESRH